MVRQKVDERCTTAVAAWAANKNPETKKSALLAMKLHHRFKDGEPGSSWTSIGIPKSKLVMALGWFHQQWVANKSSTGEHGEPGGGGGENGDTLGADLIRRQTKSQTQ